MRLTMRTSDGEAYWSDTKGGGWRSSSIHSSERAALEKLAAYEDAEEQGRLMILPCKIGDKVFRVVPKCIGTYIQCPFEGGYGLDRCYNCDAFVKEESFCLSIFEDIGKTVFLTCEEAEAVLKGGQDND